VLAAVVSAAAFAIQAGSVRGELRPSESRDVDGFYGWETGSDGTRYRWTGEYASIFVPADVTRVHIPVRMPAALPSLAPMPVEARTGGFPGVRMLVGDTWAMFDIPLPDAYPLTAFKRVNLRVDRTWQPAMYIAGSADLRPVGVEVGEVRLFRE
jgi:hypothetical protein